MARLTASVVFPTPPLPEPTAMMAPTPGRGCGDGGCCPGRGGSGVLMLLIIRGDWVVSIQRSAIGFRRATGDAGWSNLMAHTRGEFDPLSMGRRNLPSANC